MKILIISVGLSLIFLTACKSEQEKKEEESKKALLGNPYENSK